MMKRIPWFVLALALSACLAPATSQASDGNQAGFTATYNYGGAQLTNIKGFNNPESSGYRFGYQGRAMGISFGQTTMGDFTAGGSYPSHITINSDELLLSYRIVDEVVAYHLFAGASSWTFTNKTALSVSKNSGTSPVVGFGVRLGRKVGFMLSAMYYQGITDANILTVNFGINI